MLDEELQLNSWREVLDFRVQSLLRSIELERARLIAHGASDDQIVDALRHQYEILENIRTEDYPDLFAHQDSSFALYGDEGKIVFKGSRSAVKKERVKSSHQGIPYDVVFC
ncbi:MAG: hypothetical protein ABIU20_08085 [Blastocatellia bacterium]